jgi:hypothetical protein
MENKDIFLLLSAGSVLLGFRVGRVLNFTQSRQGAKNAKENANTKTGIADG